MLDVQLEVMTAGEAGKWFRRSDSWLRRQNDLLRLKLGRAQALFHVILCRAYVLGRMRGLRGAELRQLQLDAFSSFCGLRHGVASAATPVLSLHRGKSASRSA